MAERFEAASLKAIAGLAHGFFGRRGGVSHGLYESLNAGQGSADAGEHVAENRARILRRLGVDRLATAYQEHGTAVIPVPPDFEEDARPKGDILITCSPGIALGILTADCAPVLLADPDARVIAAAHAGWRGAAAGVIEAAVAAMAGYGVKPARIHAAIGPTIAAAAYEVGEEVREAFCEKAPVFARYFTAAEAPGKYRFDLAGAVAADLHRAGVGSAEPLGLDTYNDEARFFSYRRGRHRGETDYGRQLSAIALFASG